MPADPKGDKIEQTLKAKRAEQLRREADESDRRAQGDINQMRLNRYETVHLQDPETGKTTPTKREPGFKYHSKTDQERFESYSQNSADYQRKDAAIKRRRANRLEIRGTEKLADEK